MWPGLTLQVRKLSPEWGTTSCILGKAEWGQDPISCLLVHVFFCCCFCLFVFVFALNKYVTLIQGGRER